MNNKNAYIGKNVEILFKNSVGNHEEICRNIRSYFKIDGHFLTAICSGVKCEKADVIMEFSCGRNVDANIKSYKETTAYNQLTRTSLSRFCNRFNIDCFDLLQDLFIRKAKSINSKLIPNDKQNEIFATLHPIVKDIVEWSMSYKKSREILVL
jgi:hypothetical protein